MHQIVCRLGLRPRPRWVSLQRSPRSPSWILGDLLLREGSKWEGRGGTGREGKGRGPLLSRYTPSYYIIDKGL